jgi:hypothetical protein
LAAKKAGPAYDTAQNGISLSSIAAPEFSAGPVFCSALPFPFPGPPSNRNCLTTTSLTLEPAFRISLLTFGQKLAADLRQPFPGDTSYPLDAFRLLSIFVLKAVIDGEGEVRDRLPVGGIFDFRVSSGSPNKDDFVDTNFWHILPTPFML